MKQETILPEKLAARRGTEWRPHARQWHKRVVTASIVAVMFFAAVQGRVALAQSGGAPPPTETVEATGPDSLQLAGLADAPELPDAPQPATKQLLAEINDAAEESTSLAGNRDFADTVSDPFGFGVSSSALARVPLNECPFDTTHAKECRPHWRQLLITSSVFNAFQNAGNLYTGYWYRVETTQGKWFQRWFDSDLGWRWGQWNDGNPFLDDYVGHPMMGAITSYMWIQNDPRAMTVDFGNNRQYWHSRLYAMVYSTAYSFEWKFGPFGEAGVGHNGDHATDTIHGVRQNDTGDVELVTTPVGGLVWNVAEDMIDKYVVEKMEETPRSPFALLAISILTPARATANIFRFRPPWYRDGRQVKARSFWSDPRGTDDDAARA